jgi:hypothetical protein
VCGSGPNVASAQVIRMVEYIVFQLRSE